MKLEVENWKEYKLTDIFELRGGFYNKKPEHTEVGNIPFLASTEMNNGVTEYYTLEDIKAWDKVGGQDHSIEKKIFAGGCIAVTVNGSVCNAFYQNREFTCSHDITVLYPKNHNLTCAEALFLCTVIMAEKYRWSYGRKPHDVKKFGKSIIRLPSTSEGIPDWDYMEQYIKSLNHKPLATANRGGYGSHTLGVEHWSEFKIGDLFDIKNGKGITHEEIEENPGDLIAIQSGEENNAVIGKIDYQYCVRMNYTISNNPCLTVARSGSAGFVSFQPSGCVIGDSAKIMLLKENAYANKYTYLFLRTILIANQYKYSYGRKVTEDKYANEIVKLPSINGKPDFEFMENYIKSLPYGDKI